MILDAFILRDGLGGTAKVPKPVRVRAWERNPGGLGEKGPHSRDAPYRHLPCRCGREKRKEDLQSSSLIAGWEEVVHSPLIGKTSNE